MILCGFWTTKSGKRGRNCQSREVEVILISSLPPEKVRKLFFIPMRNISPAIDYVKNKYGKDFQVYILPSGNTVVPQLI